MSGTPRMPATRTGQINLMVRFMENNPGVAKNYLPSSQAKAKSKILWSNLAEKLNSCGPPIRTVDGWKNVWKDYKYNLKRKMRENKLHFSGTGGGPNKQKTFTDNEKATMAILELNEAVSGNSLARDFGGPSRKPSEPKDAITEEIDAVEAVIEEIFAEDANLDDDSLAFHRIAEDEALPLPKKGDTKLNDFQTIHQNTEEYAPPPKKKEI